MVSRREFWEGVADLPICIMSNTAMFEGRFYLGRINSFKEVNRNDFVREFKGLFTMPRFGTRLIPRRAVDYYGHEKIIHDIQFVNARSFEGKYDGNIDSRIEKFHFKYFIFDSYIEVVRFL